MHRNSIVIYHKDQDGLGATCPFSGLGNTYASLTYPLFDDYYKEKIRIHRGPETVFWFLDCAPSIEIAEELAAKSRAVRILDHHVAAENRFKAAQNLPPNITPVFKTDVCAAKLVDEFASQNPEIFGPSPNRIDPLLLDMIDKADRNQIRTLEDWYRVSFLDIYLGTTNQHEFCNLVSKHNALSNGEKLEFYDRMLIEGKVIYEENKTIANRLFERENHEYAPIHLPGQQPTYYTFIHLDPHARGGRIASHMACELAERENGVVFLWCNRDGVIHLSIRTAKHTDANAIAQFFKPYSVLDSGGGGGQLGCVQFWGQEFEHLFRRRRFGRAVQSNLLKEEALIVSPHNPSWKVTENFPRSPHRLADPQPR